LQALLDRLPPTWGALARPVADLHSIDITGVAEHSGRVEPGTLFLARRGRDTDGHLYIPAALEAGAVAVAGELPPAELPVPLPDGLPYLYVYDGRVAFALLSAAFYDFPGRKMTIIGVTGTDGKTTTSTLTQSILAAAGMKTGLITTISALIGGEIFETGYHVTTPIAFDLQGYLAQMVAAGCTAAVIETTSHALDQARVAWAEYDVAVVTNVTHEHLDWHGSWESYMAAKARLFHALATSARKPGIIKTAVLNRDDRSYPILQTVSAGATLTYSLTDGEGVICTAHDIGVTRGGTHFLLQTPAGTVPVQLHLLGRYNVANALAAACVGLALGVSLPAIAKGLGAVERIKGRMDLAYSGDFDVVVDFAHTPHALQETLAVARELVSPGGRVIAVFGSAGLRDVAKRRLMGEVACAADLAVITAEDPRTEDVQVIIKEIAAGLEAHGR
jgi:UDP-N-acetylmuramoyl-L-alanyl-D-glutamate--2,6-diaminopimelate ligase